MAGSDGFNTLRAKTDSGEIQVFGIFLYRDYPADESALTAFMNDFAQKGSACFPECSGAFRVRVDYSDGRSLFFADNSGFLRYYISRESGGFFPTLADAAPERAARRPNHTAIADFLSYGCVYGLETTVASVYRSDPECYYVVENGEIRTYGKELPALEDAAAPRDMLARQMSRFAAAVKNRGMIGCTITGGTDSRAVLAHLLHNGIRPSLAITEGSDCEDVRAAREIAAILDLPLTVVSTAEENPSWLDEAIEVSDGMMEVCGSYRLYKKADILHTQGIAVECGGGAGEIYKNSFINQDYPFYFGAPRWNRFLRYKVMTNDFPKALCGERIRTEVENTADRTLAFLRQHHGRNKANAYLDAGYRLLQYRSAALSAAEARRLLRYNPLLERSVAALAFHVDPYSLEMQAYQREQVTSYAPELKDVRTDRGLTCDSAKKTKEFVESSTFLLGVAFKRVFRRTKFTPREDNRFAQGLSSPQFYAALTRCKELGILAPDIQAEQLPQTIADRLFALGAFL